MDDGSAFTRVTASAGLAPSSLNTPAINPDAAVEQLIARAGRALYRAKRNGRDRLEVDGRSD